jgi:hypothetical protein
MRYKIHIRKSHLPVLGVTPSRLSRIWRKFSNSNYNNLRPLPTQAASAKTVQRPSLAPSLAQIRNSPVPIERQTRSQTTIHTQDIPNVPLPPRMVTPRTLRQSAPRVPTVSQRLTPLNLSQDDLCGMDSTHMAISLGHNHRSQQHHANAVIHPVTGKEMEYSALMKYPRLVGQTLATSGNHVESPSDLETASSALRGCYFSWSRGLQRNSFCSARMQNNRT